MEFPEQTNRISAATADGGIAAAISAFLGVGIAAGDKEFSGAGWAGVAPCKPDKWELLKDQLPENGYDWYPIFLPARHHQTLSRGFVNSVLWPLFHYFPSYVEIPAGAYEDYFDMNRQFADSLERYLRPGDTVWIHDHQLLHLAGLLRQRIPELTIGTYLHIPFPSFEIFRHLPGDWQESLLRGMLGADLIGFQTAEYAAHFRNCVRLTVETAGDGETIEVGNRLVRTGVFPVGIEYSSFNAPAETAAMQAKFTELRQRFDGKKIVFSIDTLDYTKGILHRINACAKFLQEYGDHHDHVVFIFVIIPSRENHTRYAERKKLLDESVSQVNGKFGNLRWQPLLYLYRNLSFEELLPLYRLCDVALLTPLRDAMNLYAKEFAASRIDEAGVLILSELDGAAEQLGGALAVNPYDIAKVAQAIKTGLDMSPEEQRHRMREIRESVSRHDISRWGKEYLLALQSARSRRQEFRARFFDAYSQRQLLESYRGAARRQFFLDYDGTLMPFFNQPSEARPGENVLETLSLLAADERNSVCIISGRDATVLESWLGHLPVHIVAEHGAQVRYRGEGWEKVALPAEEWKHRVIQVMDEYTGECPGAFVEKKNFSLVWHYRNAHPQLADKIKMSLYSALIEVTAGLPVQVTIGKKILEVRNRDIDKGSAVRSLLRRETGDFILAIGDDRTDEDMFRALADSRHAFTIKVGQEASYANFNVPTPQSVISLLGALGNLRS